jgi:molybdopterin adenylyltransferase
MNQFGAAVVTVSDSRSAENDYSGNELVELLEGAGITVISRNWSTDDLGEIRAVLISVAEREDVDVVISTGGTGFASRDNTPEATRSVIDREAPGIAEAIRRETSSQSPLAMLSRGICGIRGTTLIVNLPGSPKAVKECFAVLRPVLSHAIALLRGEKPH